MSKITDNVRDLALISSTTNTLSVGVGTTVPALTVSGADLTLDRTDMDFSIVQSLAGSNAGKNVTFQKAGGGPIAGNWKFRGKVTLEDQPAFMANGGGGSTAGGSTMAFNVMSNVPSSRSSGFSNNRYTAPVTGLYQFNFITYDFTNPRVTCAFQVFINGSGWFPSDAFQFIKLDSENMATWSYALYLNKDDYVQMGIRSGGPTFTQYSGHTYWTGYFVG